MKDVLACLFLKLKKALPMRELIYAYEIYKEELKKNNCRWDKMSKAIEENNFYGNYIYIGNLCV